MEEKASIDDIFSLDNPTVKVLREQYPNVQPELFVRAAIVASQNNVLGDIEVSFGNTKPVFLNELMDIYKKYSNGYILYGARPGEHTILIEKVFQLTLEDPKKLLELSKYPCVQAVRIAKKLPDGCYFHVNEIDPSSDTSYAGLVQGVHRNVKGS